MLKEAVVGGPSLVFSRYQEVGKTRIRSHRYKNPRLCKKILGYDTNALYLSTMLREMSCGKGRAVHYATSSKSRRRVYLSTGSKKENGSDLLKLTSRFQRAGTKDFRRRAPSFTIKRCPPKRCLNTCMITYLKQAEAA